MYTPIKLHFITGKNGKGIYLQPYDLEVLYFIYEQKTVAQSQAFLFHQLFTNIHYNQFRNKMSKFERYGLIEKRKYYLAKKYRFRIDLLSITNKGMSILYHIGWISNVAKKPNKPKRNFDHLLGTKQIILDALLLERDKLGYSLAGGGEHTFRFREGFNNPQTLYYFDDVDIGRNKDALPYVRSMFSYEQRERMHSQAFPLYSYSPHIHPLYRDVNENIILLPDWTLKINRTFFHVEVDSGTEKYKKNANDAALQITSLERKFENYIELSKQYPQYHHVVLFITLDDSITLRGDYGLMTKRLANLKREITSIPGFITSSLDLYCFRLERTKDSLQTLFDVARDNFDWDKQLKTVANSLYLNRAFFPYEVKLISELSFIERVVPYSKTFVYPIDRIFYCKPRNKEGELLEKMIIPVKMFEGDVRSQDKLLYFAEKIKEGVLGEGTKILALYQTKRTMEEDVYRTDFISEHVISANLQELHNFKQKPIFYDPVRKGETPFE